MTVRSESDKLVPPRIEVGTRDGLSLADMARLLRSRARTVLACVLATSALGLAVIALTPTTYKAHTSLLVDPTIRAPLGSASGVVAQGGPDTALINSQVRLLTSSSVLQRVVSSQHLMDDPDFTAPPGLLGRLKTLVFGSSVPVNTAVRADIIASALEHDVTVSHVDESNVIDITASARRPGKAARLANALVAAYFADQQQARDRRDSGDSAALDVRLAKLRQQFLQSESAYDAWRASHQLFDADGKPLGEIDLGNATKILADARAKTAAAKASFHQVEAVEATGHGVGTLSAALKSSLIDKLRSQYADVARQKAMYASTLGPRNPALIQSESQLRTIAGLIHNELHRIAANAASQYQEARAAEVAAQRQVTALKADSAKSSAFSAQALQLKNDVDARRSVYQRFLRARESMASAPVDGQLARVISPAIPPLYAAAPAKKLIMALALVGGLFLGAVWALLGHMLARVPDVAARQEASSGEATPVMASDAAAPIGEPGWQGKAQQPAAQPLPAMQVLFDDILADCRATTPPAGLVSVMVAALTADAAQDMAALDLALAGAARGLRVLLIESNRAQPVYASRLSRASGLPVLLAGTVRPSYLLKGSDLVRIVPVLRDEAAALRTMPPGAAPIAGFNGHFDLVLFEVGLLGRDDRLPEMARHVDRVIFITQARRSGAAQVSRALRYLDVPPDRLGGVWISDRAISEAA